MKAALIEKYGQDNLDIRNISIPKIGDNEVLVKVIAASINPIDLKTMAGDMRFLLNYKLPLVIGSDFSGIVEKVGKNVHSYKPGDSVYGRVLKNQIGTFAEYLAVDQTAIALKPESLSFEQAAAVPLVGLTSYQALHNLMHVKSGDKVLIEAGSGGIGTIAIQIAKFLGAYVATTTSTKNVAFVKQLGADKVVDYHKNNFWDVLSDYDYVFDTLGGSNLEKAFQILKPGGTIVTIAGTPDYQFAQEYGLPKWKQVALSFASRKLTRLEWQYHVNYQFLFMQPSGNELELLSELIVNNKIHPVIDKIFPFLDIQTAIDYQRKGHSRGKNIIKIAES